VEAVNQEQINVDHMTALAKTSTLFDRSNTGMLGSDLTQDLDIFPRLLYAYAVLCK
jgi:hypothetical protein